MKKLLVATTNAGKAREIRHMLPAWDVQTLKDAGIDVDVVEDADTFAGNARKKAVEISRLTGDYVLADDSGLSVDGLGGAPGVLSARYSGGGDDANNQLLMRNIQPLDKQGRRAHFHCAMAVAKGGEVLYECEGRVDGEALTELRGEGGFGYDPLFYLAEYGKTFGELPEEVKNTISHRARALALARAFLERL